MARGPIPDKPRDRPTVPEVGERVREYLAKADNWNGGNLHITLADQNETDDDIRWCRDRASERGDVDGMALADVLLQLTRTQRRRVCRTVW